MLTVFYVCVDYQSPILSKDAIFGDTISLFEVIWAFFGTQAIIFSLYAAVEYSIPNTSETVVIQLKRRRYLEEKLFTFEGKSRLMVEVE